MPNSAIWFLVACEEQARIYESRHGSCQHLRTIPNTSMPAARDIRGANVVPLHGKDSVPATKHDRNRDFAFQLTLILLEAAEARTCDGMIVVATRAMIVALRRVRPLMVSRILISEIVEAAPDAIGRAMAASQAADSENSNAIIKLALTAAASAGASAVSHSTSDAFVIESGAEAGRQGRYPMRPHATR